MVQQPRKIIDRLGGPTKVAKVLDLDRTAIYHWLKPGKAIPYWYHQRLMAHARDNGIKLKPADFVGRG